MTSKKKLILQGAVAGFSLPACFTVPVYFYGGIPFEAVWQIGIIFTLFGACFAGLLAWGD